MDGRTLQSSSESGPRAGYDGNKPWHCSKVHMAVDTLDHLLAVHVTPTDEQEWAQVRTLCEQMSSPRATLWSGPGLTVVIRVDRPAKRPSYK